MKSITFMYIALSLINSFFCQFHSKWACIQKKSFPCLIQIRSQAQFQDLCQQHVRGEAEGTSSGCCPSWSLGNYLAVLTNASCCLSLTSHQVLQLSSHLENELQTNEYIYFICRVFLNSILQSFLWKLLTIFP